MSFYEKVGGFVSLHCLETELTSMHTAPHPGTYVPFTNHLSALNSQGLLCCSPRCQQTPLTGQAKMCFDNRVVSLASRWCPQVTQWRKLWLFDEDRTLNGLPVSGALAEFILRLLVGFVWAL